MGLYKIKVQGSEENIKMQRSRKALISQLVGPQIYREKRASWTGKGLWFYSVQRSSPSHLYRIAVPDMQIHANNSL